MIVVKVGGSLYDEPRLGPALRLWLSEQPEPVLLVPGGGDFADAVRKLDRVHGLGAEAAHWLAIRSMSLAGAFLERVMFRADRTAPSPATVASLPVTTSPSPGKRWGTLVLPIPSTTYRGTPPLPCVSGGEVAGGCTATPASEGDLERRGYFILDAFAFFREHDLTPHTWAVTSDSLAAAVAIHSNASQLILLKSTDIPPGTPWAVAVARGWVDSYFPTLVEKASVRVESVNFRQWMKNRFPDAEDELT